MNHDHLPALGVWSHADLIGSAGRPALHRAIAENRLLHIGHGWYATGTADPAVLGALRLGCRLGCLSVLRLHGVWTPPDSFTHVFFRRNQPPRSPDRLDHRLQNWPDRSPTMSLWHSLESAVLRHEAETAVIVLESAVEQKLITLADARTIAAIGQVKKQRILRRVRAGAQSGTETRLRLFFELRGVPVKIQVPIPDVGHVDLLVGDSLVLEADSRAHHSHSTSYATDRRRDLELRRAGFSVIRLTYLQVFGDWDRTSAALSQILRSRRHRFR
ncbi:DUF559 domain-containing protein [Naumannella halotolerans]|uniref:Very-short-patch-repair endonuclease n=1 Tax=Naumannella halotolerans TaxID=993414 RepID=A0A4R7J5N5_9ACTN|nr:DUF559 domain-containing protein [Naumannella halotolerans]TDT32475.1 very-short-patch-repair endonuclease [Naumannella halotolerans]